MKSTAVAHSNIALVKYWGKRDEKLFLPMNSSISMTLDKLSTKTTVEFSDSLKEDDVTLNNSRPTGGDLEEITAHLDRVRRAAKVKEKAKVVSENNFPTASGLASSASGLAALTVAASAAAGLKLDSRQLSILARQGSGSSSRSIMGGFVEWTKGDKSDGSDSYATQLASEKDWEGVGMLVTVLTRKAKKVRSRAGMAQTLRTSPLYKGWLDSVEADLESVRKGIKSRDFGLVGRTAEENCLKMHATMLTTKPSIIYWLPVSMEVIHSVIEWREAGLECYFTIDAGPHVKIWCKDKDVQELRQRLSSIQGIEEVIHAKPGPDARLVKEHFF